MRRTIGRESLTFPCCRTIRSDGYAGMIRRRRVKPRESAVENRAIGGARRSPFWTAEELQIVALGSAAISWYRRRRGRWRGRYGRWRRRIGCMYRHRRGRRRRHRLRRRRAGLRGEREKNCEFHHGSTRRAPAHVTAPARNLGVRVAVPPLAQSRLQLLASSAPKSSNP